MKSLFTLTLLGIGGFALLGCEASAEIDPDDDNDVELRHDRDDGGTRIEADIDD